MPEPISQENDCVDYIEFGVLNLEQAKAFYANAFGWTFTDYGETYCEFTDGRIKGGFETVAEVKNGGPLIVLYHEDLESAQARIVDAGGEITKQIFQFPGGERFQFKDPSGHELAVWRHV